MPGGFLNQARMSISSSGTGAFTLSVAVPPFQTFANAGAVDQQIVAYSAIDGVTASEKGWGLYSAAGPTLTRNVFTSTNGNAPINASINTQVFIDPSAADLTALNSFTHATHGGL